MNQTVWLAQQAGGDWRWQALTSSFGLVCLGLGVASIVGLMFCARILWRTGRPGRNVRRALLLTDRDGTAMIEFVLVFPILLFFILLLTQATMAMGGNLFVHYAAYAAARTAIVQIPADDSATGEGPDIYIQGSGNVKCDLIRRAAVFAVVPACGRSTQAPASGLDVNAYISGLTSFYQAYNKQPPAWITNGVLADRLRYADANTTIQVYHIDSPANPNDAQSGLVLTPCAQGVPYTFGPKDPVTVEVTHKLNLAVPYVRALFAQARQGDSMYKTLTAQYTLNNEGIDMDLPPLPPLPRQP